jgi:hypothetical protein
VRVSRSTLPYYGFAAYALASLLMINDPRHPILPPPLSGKIQLSELVFAVGIVAWLAAGLPGLARVARAAAVPAGVWLGANAITATVSVRPGAAWREAAAFLYLGLVLVWGAALLVAPARLEGFSRWWLGVVSGIVLAGIVGDVGATLLGHGNYLVYQGRDMYLFGDHVFRIRSTLVPTTKLLATLLILVLPVVFTIRRFGTPGERRVCNWLLVLMTLCQLLTFSRQILEYGAMLGLLAWLESSRRRRIVAVALAAAYVVGFVGVLALSTWRITDHEITRATDLSRALTDRHYYSTIPAVGVQTVDVRLEYVYDNYHVLKRVGWKGFLERPLLGWGPDAWPSVLAWAKSVGEAPAALRFESAQSEVFTIAAEMGLVGLAARGAFWVLCIRGMAAPTGQSFAATLARYHALALGGVLLTSIHLDVMRFRFLWIALAVGMAAANCARQEVA